MKKKYAQQAFFSHSLLTRFTLHIFLTISELIISYTIILSFIGITEFLWIVWLSLLELDCHLHKFLITDSVKFTGSINSQFTVVSSTFSTSSENDKNKGVYGHLGFSTNKRRRGDIIRIALKLTSNFHR